MSDPEIIGLQVHPHLVGFVTETTGRDGEKRLISSATVKPHLNLEVPPKYRTEIEEIIEVIQYKVASLGFFSSKFIGLDELDNNYYQEDELICKVVQGSTIKGLYHPYNMVVFHPKNEWRFECLQIAFYLENEIIPSQNHNFPRILQIPRSNGSVQTAIIKEDEGIVIRKSMSNDLEKEIHIIVHFSNTDPTATEENQCIYTKRVPLDDILKLNDNIKDIKIEIPQLDLDNLEGNELEVKKHYNQKFNEWGNEVLSPIISRVSQINFTIS
jgi:hypothetical protein